MINNTISHYKIISQLGEGGMGVVYLAEDTKLKRDVAIKFLPRHIAAKTDEQKRFKIEAQAAAALNHPNIAHIYAIEEVENEMFIVMEYIDGEELKEKISKGPITIDEAIKIATQIAEGLQAAHEKGIVHRDIKSSNIMITEKGKVKIMDFGLAKVGKGIQLTKEQSTLGTAPYMSPEQIRGDEVDQRTDIWSFGIVLHEMLTGRFPFKGDYEQAVIYSILNQEPDTRSVDLPDALISILQKSLQKNVQDRYRKMADILEELKSGQNVSMFDDSSIYKRKNGDKSKFIKKILPVMVITLVIVVFSLWFFLKPDALPEGRIPIAVADFENLSGEPELDGLSGMLITALEQSRRLAVVTRSRMFDILDQMGKKDVDRIDESLGWQICQQANISAMVVASIRKFGKLYTIDLKVVDHNKNEYLFTAKEEAKGQESIPSMLDNLSEKTRIGLKERVAQIKESSQNVASITTNNLEAYQHFFQGEQLINQLKFEEAIEEFKKAVALDSSFTQAYYRLAYAESWENKSEVIQKNHLDRVLKNMNRIPERERYLVRALSAISGDDYNAGIAILKEMEQIYPDDKEMIYNIGDWSWHLDDYTTAVAYLEKILQIDPNHQRALQHLTWTYRDMENYAKMLKTAKRYVAVSGSGESFQLLGDTYTKLGQLEQGITKLQQALDLFPDNYRILRSIADLYTYKELYPRAEKGLLKLIEKKQPSRVKHIGYDDLADFYPYLGKYRQALYYADKGIELSWQNGDTTRALISHNRKATLLLLGWNDPEKAWKEAEKTFPFNKNISSTPYWGSLTFVLVYRGKYIEALNISKDFPLKWQYQFMRSIIYNLKGDEKNAKALSDSSFQNNPDFANTFLLYTRAECQYDNGLYDDALTSLKKLPALNSNYAGYRAAYYPKSLHLMGKIFEKKGDIDNAFKSYEKFLDLWKDADKDLSDLIDAKKRYARLVSTK